jgi:vacuolar-type H+-ATPase subunit F/Vma7
MKHYIAQFTMYGETGNITLYQVKDGNVDTLVNHLMVTLNNIIDNVTDEVDYNYIEITEDLAKDLKDSIYRKITL